MSAGRGGGDVVIVGGGLVGLASAGALSARGAQVVLITESRRGEASRAAAGMLAPGIERADGAAHRFAIAARDLYPSYLGALAELTGLHVPLNRDGVLELLRDPQTAESRRAALNGGEWLSPEALRRVEPGIGPAAGAVLYPHDGAVDNVALVEALRALVRVSTAIAVVEERAVAVRLDGARPAVRLASGREIAAGQVVLAAGAWTPKIAGLPRPVPVEPVRGQIVAVAAAPIRHVTYGPRGYVVPRSDSLSVVGSTMEHVGFEVGTTPEAVSRLESAAAEIAPGFAGARTVDRWSGIRPVTPDFLPILGRDPDYPALIYACGHSRNGILLGPLTGECVAALATGERPQLDIEPFSIARFAGKQ